MPFWKHFLSQECQSWKLLDGNLLLHLSHTFRTSMKNGLHAIASRPFLFWVANVIAPRRSHLLLGISTCPGGMITFFDKSLQSSNVTDK
jgi:hypothetical protein